MTAPDTSPETTPLTGGKQSTGPSCPCSFPPASAASRTVALTRATYGLEPRTAGPRMGSSGDGRCTPLAGLGSTYENGPRVIQQPFRIRRVRGADPSQAYYKVPGTVTHRQAFPHPWESASSIGRFEPLVCPAILSQEQS